MGSHGPCVARCPFWRRSTLGPREREVMSRNVCLYICHMIYDIITCRFSADLAHEQQHGELSLSLPHIARVKGRRTPERPRRTRCWIGVDQQPRIMSSLSLSLPLHGRLPLLVVGLLLSSMMVVGGRSPNSILVESSSKEQQQPHSTVPQSPGPRWNRLTQTKGPYTMMMID